MKHTSDPQKGFAHLILLFILVIALVAGGIYWFSTKGMPVQKKVAYTGPTEKIVIGNVGEHSVLNLIAKDNGYFSENGIDAEIKEYASGPAAITDLLAGKVQIAVGAEFAGVRTIFTNKDIRILAQSSKHKIFEMLGRKDRGINEPENLKGKKIGVTRKGAGEFFLGQFLTSYDIALSDIELVDLPPADLVSQLESGALDAAVIYDPFAYNLKLKLGDALSEWSVQGDTKAHAMLYSTNTFIQGHEDLVRRYIQSVAEAERYVHENPDKTRAFLAEKFGYDDAYTTFMLENVEYKLGLDQDLLLTMEDQSRWIIENKLTDEKKVPNYLNYIYFDALEKVKPESITIIR